MTEDQINYMIDRFLGWKLPGDFNPDAGISFKAAFNEHTAHPMKHEPSGTNLFDAMQAKAMIQYMLEGLPASGTDSGTLETGECMTCYEQDEKRCSDQMCLRSGCRLKQIQSSDGLGVRHRVESAVDEFAYQIFKLLEWSNVRKDRDDIVRKEWFDLPDDDRVGQCNIDCNCDHTFYGRNHFRRLAVAFPASGTDSK